MCALMPSRQNTAQLAADLLTAQDRHACLRDSLRDSSLWQAVTTTTTFGRCNVQWLLGSVLFWPQADHHSSKRVELTTNFAWDGLWTQ